MSRQQFTTTAQLQLRIETDPAPGLLPNLVKNRNGQYGGWGWLSPVKDTTISEGLPGLKLLTPTSQACYFTTEMIPVTGTNVRASFTRTGGTATTVGVRASIEFYTAAQVLISATTPIAVTTTNGTYVIGSTACPGGTKFVKLRFDMYRSGGNPAAADFTTINNVILVNGSAAVVGAATLNVGTTWLNVLGPTHEITVERDELDLGILVAIIRDATLDPSQASTIRKGRLVQLLAGSEELFDGTILKSRVTYDPDYPVSAKRARIELQCVDPLNTLAGVARSEGVATVPQLAYVLEGAGVPWSMNGSGAHIEVPPIVARNENASAVDQVAITRDSVMGYAWVDRRGVLQVSDPASISNTVIEVLDESDYNTDLELDFDSERLINSVRFKLLRINPTTGDTEEVAYGPIEDTASIYNNGGVYGREYVVQGVSETITGGGTVPDALVTMANAILAANANPALRITGMTLPIATTADITDKATLDLYDLVRCQNTASGINALQRITSIRHSITPSKWLVTLGFSPDGTVAAPQVVPSPGQPEGKTLNELLRPVGEITMYGGSTIPTGWLKCDGSSVAVAAYPALFAAIGYTHGGSGANFTLPNLTDRFPIGAGTKALGTSGGNATKTIAASNLPTHVHGIDHNHAAVNIPLSYAANTNVSSGAGIRVTNLDNTTGGAGSAANASVDLPNFTGLSGDGAFSNTPLDILNPWRALWFIIRAA